MNTMRESHSCDCGFCEVVTWEYSVDPGPPEPPVLQDYITGDMYHANTRPMVSWEHFNAAIMQTLERHMDRVVEQFNQPSLLWRRLNATTSTES